MVFLLGQAADLAEARRLVTEYRQPGRALRTLEDVRRWWDQVLTTVQVRTPNQAMDLLLNRWLLYQTLGCRYPGAVGVLPIQRRLRLSRSAPGRHAPWCMRPRELTRQHILRAAGRQFAEGDVQHWWHPPSGRGVRTRFSDDYLWLPFVVATMSPRPAIRAVLDEQVPFLQAPLLKPEQEEDYGLPHSSTGARPRSTNTASGPSSMACVLAPMACR